MPTGGGRVGLSSIDLTAGFSGWRDVDAFQFFYMVLPLFRGSYEATGVFYFDFVRLRRIAALREFRLEFFHKLLWATPSITLFYWSLAIPLGLYVLPDIPFGFLLALLPLFLVRSFIGVYQVRLFAEGRFRSLNVTIVFSAGLFALVWFDANPASDLVQLTAAMIALLIVHINLQHFQDRTTPQPTLLSLRDWIRALSDEVAPVRVGRIAIPEWVASRQKSAAVALIDETIDGSGRFAFRSATKLVFYERDSHEDNRRPTHLKLQTITGGTANRGETLPAPTTDGRMALDSMIAAGWLPPIDDMSALGSGPERLVSEFAALFPGGIARDLETGAGIRDMRTLEQGVLARILPAVSKSLAEGAVATSLSGRWISPVFHQAKLRLIFVLPPEFEADLLRRWLRILKAWHACSSTTESTSYARSG